MSHTGIRGGAIALLLLASLTGSSATAQSGRTILYVNTDAGDDGNSGTLALPYRTLNRALRRAFEIRYDLPTPCTSAPTDKDTDVVIKVAAPTTPVAPWGHGGYELDGWQSYADECDSFTPPAFPIRMVERVAIEGVRSGGVQAKVLIDEDGGNTPFDWGSTPVLRRSLFHAASSSRLGNLELSGELYHKKKTDKINAVFAENVSAFVLADCRIDDLFDGAYFSTSIGTHATVASVTDCQFVSLGPITFSDPDNLDQGHAGAWLVGPGTLDILFSGVRFEGSHDAIEVSGTVVGEDEMDGRLSITGCEFVGNENGIEAVGSGELVAAISDCEFTNNYNLEQGMPLFHVSGAPHSPGAIAARNGTNTITVRTSTFFNNAFSFLANAPGTYDFGIDGSNAGNNTFNLDFSAFTGVDDPIRVMMFVLNPSAVVTAGGNTWYNINLNQGTNSAGCLTGSFTGHSTLGLNLVEVTLVDQSVIRVPPGPDVGQCCDPATNADWKRNYSLAPNASIDFGAGCLP